MFKEIRLNIILLFVVSLLTVAKCIHEHDVIKAPISVEIINKADDLILHRIKRQVFGLGTGKPYPPVAAQSRAPTVIVIPEKGTGAVPTYGNVPISPYSVRSPNRGTSTTVVVKVPEDGYNGVAGTYDIMPNPIRI